MKNVTIKTDNNPGAPTIYNAIRSSVDGLTIKIEGENFFEVKSEVISCSFPTHITGNGSLTLKSEEECGIIITNDNFNITVEISDITLSVEAARDFMWSATPQGK